ncbi:MAG: hypothetical protein DRJ60_05280 [Thermoprotei archaeon]|nr:MAG: hypothetical protein DRJ60_05280 [Thermoprotei archaeon]
MELTVSRIIWLVIGIALVIGIGMVVYTWSFRAFVKTDYMATIVAYDNGRAEIALKNVGTVDITSLKVRIIAADGSKLATPVELLVKLADGSDFEKLSAGEEVQLICDDWTDGGTVSAKNALTFEIVCGFANGRTVSHTYTVPIQTG